MKKKLLSVLMAAVMVAGVGGVGAAQVKADDEKILGAGIYSAWCFISSRSSRI